MGEAALTGPNSISISFESGEQPGMQAETFLTTLVKDRQTLILTGWNDFSPVSTRRGFWTRQASKS